MILDTNTLSGFIGGDSGAILAVSRLKQVVIPVIVIGEYRFGITQSRHKSLMERTLDEFLQSCKILDIDSITARYYAEVRVNLKRTGTPIPGNDAWIAALSRQYSLPILSRDTHFDYVSGVKRTVW